MGSTPILSRVFLVWLDVSDHCTALLFVSPQFMHFPQILPFNIILVATRGGWVNWHVYFSHLGTFVLSIHKCITDPVYDSLIID